jgi:hypothetical protein
MTVEPSGLNHLLNPSTSQFHAVYWESNFDEFCKGQTIPGAKNTKGRKNIFFN